MPIYEFFSPDTGKIYTFFARSLKYSSFVPNCPDGENFRMQKNLSSFSVTGTVSDESSAEIGSGTVGGDSDDPFANLAPGQAEKVMKELEGSMSSMDEENPDPRQMGALMRKMCDMTGEKMEGAMEEVVRKLEEGVDPEELEERIGDNMDDEGNPSGSDLSSEKMDKSRIRSQPLKVVRDPKLYEMGEFLKS